MLKQYKNPRGYRLAGWWFFGLSSLVFILGVVSVPVFLVRAVENPFEGILIGSVSFIFSAYMLNLYPDIDIDGENIWVQFMWSKVKVHRSDIIGVKQIRKLPELWLVKTRGLTRFHILYGLFWGHSFSPCFIIGPGIVEHDTLILEIKRLAKRNSLGR